MACYSVQPRDRIFLKGYEFFTFSKNIVKNNGKCISNNLSSKYSKKILDHAVPSRINWNCFKKAILKTEKQKELVI